MTKCRQSKIRAVIAVCSRESEQTWKKVAEQSEQRAIAVTERT